MRALLALNSNDLLEEENRECSFHYVVLFSNWGF